MIIDSHLHITHGFHGLVQDGPTRSSTYGRVFLGDHEFQLLPPLHPGKTAFEPETLLRLMDWVGVDKSVLLQGSFYGDQNDYLSEAVKKWPNRFTAAAYIDPRGEAHAQFELAVEEFGFRILKFELSESTGFCGVFPDLRLDSDEMNWIWQKAAERDLVVTLDLGKGRTPAYQTADVESIVARHPKLKIVICHLAQPPIADQQDKELNQLWREQVLLGRHANVWLDTSALPAYAEEDYPFPIALDYMHQAADLVGADKLMWGSDIPGLLGQATYQQCLNMVRRHSRFSPAELDLILGETANKVYFQ